MPLEASQPERSEPQSLRLLIVEDVRGDAQLCSAPLERAGSDVTADISQTEAEVAALLAGRYRS